MPASVRPEVQRIVAAARELGIDGDQVLHVGNLARQDDAVARQARAPRRAARCRSRTRPAPRASRAPHRSGFAELRVLVHQARQQVLVETAPVDADAHRLAELDGLARSSPRTAESCLLPLPTLPGLMRYLAERLRALGIIGQQLVTVEVEVADQRHRAAQRVEPFPDRRHGRRGFDGVDGDRGPARTRRRPAP